VRSVLWAWGLGLAVSLCGCGGSTGSIGAVLARDNEARTLHIRETPVGHAAARAGLMPGDEIVMIEGYYVRDLTPKQIQTLLRGDPGTKLELTIVRGGQVRNVKLERTALREKKPPKGEDENEEKQEVEE
jgi:C-terminal processing protease CtpA/Prc